MALEDKNTGSFQSTEEICLLSSVKNIMSSTTAKFKQVCLEPSVKDSDSLSSVFFIFETNQVHVQNSPQATPYYPIKLGGKGNRYKHKDHFTVNNKAFSL